MQKNVSERLPDSETGYGPQWNKTKKVVDPRQRACAAKGIGEQLDEKNACANEDEKLDARRDESTPVEVIAPRAERSPHDFSVRRRIVRVKAGCANG